LDNNNPNIKILKDKVMEHDKRLNYLSTLIQNLYPNEYIERSISKNIQNSKEEVFNNLSEILEL